MSVKKVEQEIQAKSRTAPRVTLADVEDNILSEYYFTAKEAVANYHPATPHLIAHASPEALAAWDRARRAIDGTVHKSLGLLTFCVLVLKNGFAVTGESACVSPGNFDAELGRALAREKAINKVWELMGYALKQHTNN